MRIEGLAHVLILAGMILIALALLIIPFLMMSSSPSVSGGACVVILFLPICFGLGEQPLLMVVITMLLALVMIVVSYLFLRTLVSSEQN